MHLCTNLRKHDTEQEPATKSCCQGRRKKWQKLTYIASWLNLGLFVFRKRCNISTHQITPKCDVLVTEEKRDSRPRELVNFRRHLEHLPRLEVFVVQGTSSCRLHVTTEGRLLPGRKTCKCPGDAVRCLGTLSLSGKGKCVVI